MYIKPVEYNVKRLNPRFDLGLNDSEVLNRKEQNLTNKQKVRFGKSCLKILKDNFLTLFNLFVFVFLILWVALRKFGDPIHYPLIILGVCLVNLFLGLIRDFSLKSYFKKHGDSFLAHVIRNGKEVEIDYNDIVLDDVLSLKQGDVIPADSVLLTGNVTVNEANISGKTTLINKNSGDFIYSGSVIVEGECFARVDRIGKDNVSRYLDEQKIKKEKTPLEKSLFQSYLTISIFALAIIVLPIIIHLIMDIFDVSTSLYPVINQLSVIIPLGLSLLINITLLIHIYKLKKRNVLITNPHALEAFSRSDVVVIDKTGTLTDGRVEVHNIVPLVKPLGEDLTSNEINGLIYNILTLTDSKDETSKALLSHINPSIKNEAIKVLPYNDDNKYCGVSFVTGMTYILGSIESLNVENKSEVLDLAKNYQEKGYRVILLGKSNKLIKGESFYEMVKPLAFIVLQDNVKKEIEAVFSWLNENNIEVKVVSGDNPISTSEAARQAGIKGAEKYISLEGISFERLEELLDEYVVFANADKEQKAEIVRLLKKRNKSVTMIGDGYNDVIALKEANCAISMNSGVQEAKNQSDIVLLNNDLSSFKEIYDRGRRSNNALTKLTALYLTKSLFGVIISLAFILISTITHNKYPYPFSFDNFLLYEGVSIVLTLILIAFDKDRRDIRKDLAKELHAKVVFSSLCLSLGVLATFILYLFHVNNVTFIGIETYGYDVNNPFMLKDGFTMVATLVTSLLSVFTIIYILKPMRKYHKLVAAFIAFIMLTIFTLCYLTTTNVIGLDFSKLTVVNLIAVAAISLIIGMAFLTIQSIYQRSKGR